MSLGRVILMNGPSSSGKSSIAKALQTLLPEPYLHLGIDTFLAMLPGRYFGEQPTACEGLLLVRDGSRTAIQTGSVGLRLLQGMYASFAALAAAGNNLIIDHVILDCRGLNDLLHALSEFPVLFVGVHCPLEVLVQRERGRPDRVVGMAQAQHAIVHTHCLYDLEVDTSVQSPAEAARCIQRRMEDALPATACKRLMSLNTDQES